MILVYSHKITHRTKYIFRLIFKDVLKYSRETNSEFNIISLLWHDNVLKMKGGRMYPKILEFLSSQDDVVMCNGIDLVNKIKKL